MIPKLRKYHRMAWDSEYAERVYDRAWDRLFSKRASQRYLIRAVKQVRADARAGRVTEHGDFMAELDRIIEKESR